MRPNIPHAPSRILVAGEHLDRRASAALGRRCRPGRSAAFRLRPSKGGGAARCGGADPLSAKSRPSRAQRPRPLPGNAWEYFRHDLTPNEAFFVRWHLEAIPTHVELRTWRLRVDGHVECPLELSMEDLRRMEAVSVVAVNQCSGNSRSLFAPRVPGGQWNNGAMGNARWTGARLGDLLLRAGLRAGAVQVVLDGLDEGRSPRCLTTSRPSMSITRASRRCWLPTR